MRSAVVRRPRVARPRRDAIALTIPKKWIWIAGGAVAGFGIVSCAIGIWIGRGTAETPAPLSTRVIRADLEVPPVSPRPEEGTPIDEPPPPAAPMKKPAKLDLNEHMPRGTYGVQVGAFPSKAEARKFLEEHSTEFARQPMVVVAVKVRSKGVFYRVRVGSFETAAEATRFIKALPDELAKSAKVVKYKDPDP